MASGEDPTQSKQYYSILGLRRDASASAIRTAYKKLAMKWHPDKCIAQDPAEAKIKFQEIQEAYAVLSDDSKKTLYDCGLYRPEDDEEDAQGFSSFMSEMSGMMAQVRAEETGNGNGNSFEDLQNLFVSMFRADLAAFTSNPSNKQNWAGAGSNTFPFFESCIVEESTAQPQSHLFFDSFKRGGLYGGDSGSCNNKHFKQFDQTWSN